MKLILVSLRQTKQVKSSGRSRQQLAKLVPLNA